MPPKSAYLKPEQAQGWFVRRYTVILEMPTDYSPQPQSYFRYGIMHASFEFEFDLLQLRLQSLADGLPVYEETASPGFPTNMRETQKIEDLWLPLATLSPVYGCIATKFQQSCLFRM